MSTWEATVPLLDKHRLTPQARDELLAKAIGRPVKLGRPQEHEAPPRAERHDPPVGRCVGAYPQGEGQVRLVLQLDDGRDDARAALECLRAHTHGIGLDATVTMGDRPDGDLGDGRRPIAAVHAVRALAVVPLHGSGARYEEAE